MLHNIHMYCLIILHEDRATQGLLWPSGPTDNSPIYKRYGLISQEGAITNTVSSISKAYMQATRTARRLKPTTVFSPFLWTSENANISIALDEATVKAMLAREKDLHRCSTAQRAYSLRCVDSMALARQIRMRIVREYGLPDEATEIFASYPREYSEQAEVETDTEVFGRKWNEPPDLQLQNEPSEAPQVAATAQVVPILSEIMPDIAIPSGPDLTIATAPPINQMLLREPELGDSHSQAKGGSGSNKGGKPVKGNKHGPDQFTDV